MSASNKSPLYRAQFIGEALGFLRQPQPTGLLDNDLAALYGVTDLRLDFVATQAVSLSAILLFSIQSCRVLAGVR